MNNKKDLWLLTGIYIAVNLVILWAIYSYAMKKINAQETALTGNPVGFLTGLLGGQSASG